MATYIVLNLIFICLALGYIALQKRRSYSWRLIGVTLCVLVVCTAIFDSLIIQWGIVAYDYAKTLGFMVGAAPIEDFFYALLAGIFIPVLWHTLGAPNDNQPR